MPPSHPGVVAESSLSNIRTVYASCGEADTLRRYSDALQGSFLAGKREAAVKGVALGTHGLILWSWGGMLWLGGWLVANGKATGGNVFGTALAVIIAGQ